MNLRSARLALQSLLQHEAAYGPLSSNSEPVREDLFDAEEFDLCFAFTPPYSRAMDDETIERRQPGYIVPKDGSPAHLVPAELTTELYVKIVSEGERWWADPPQGPSTTVEYRGIVDPASPTREVGGVIRRRTTNRFPVDESFTRNFRWEKTERLLREEFGLGGDYDYPRITAEEAVAFIRRARSTFAPPLP